MLRRPWSWAVVLSRLLTWFRFPPRMCAISALSFVTPAFIFALFTRGLRVCIKWGSTFPSLLLIGFFLAGWRTSVLFVGLVFGRLATSRHNKCVNNFSTNNDTPVRFLQSGGRVRSLMNMVWNENERHGLRCDSLVTICQVQHVEPNVHVRAGKTWNITRPNRMFHTVAQKAQR